MNLLSGLRARRVERLVILDDAIELIPSRAIIERSIDDPALELMELTRTLWIAAAAVIMVVEAPRNRSSPSEEAPAQLPFADYEDLAAGERAELLTPLLEAVSGWLAEPRIVMPAAHDDGETAEVRGKVGELSVRTGISWLGTPFASSTTRVELGVTLLYDPEKKPCGEETEEDDLLRYFVAPGVYFEGDARTVDVGRTVCEHLTPALLDRIAETFAAQGLHALDLGAVVRLETWPAIMEQEYEGVERSLRNVFDLCVALGDCLGAGEVRHLQRDTCRYCRSSFFFGPHRETCPNCGAPVQA